MSAYGGHTLIDVDHVFSGIFKVFFPALLDRLNFSVGYCEKMVRRDIDELYRILTHADTHIRLTWVPFEFPIARILMFTILIYIFKI